MLRSFHNVYPVINYENKLVLQFTVQAAMIVFFCLVYLLFFPRQIYANGGKLRPKMQGAGVGERRGSKDVSDGSDDEAVNETVRPSKEAPQGTSRRTLR